MSMNFEKPAFYSQPDNDEQLVETQEQVSYSPEDLAHLDQASDAAAEIIRWSLESDVTSRKTIETSEGTRGYVSNTFAGGSVEGLFEGAKLSQVGIKLDNGGETKQLSIQGLEDGEQSRVFIDGQLVDPREIPAVQQVVEAIRQEISAAEEVIKQIEETELPAPEQLEEAAAEPELLAELSDDPEEMLDRLEEYGVEIEEEEDEE